MPRLLAPIAAGGISRLEWLGSVPSGKGPTSLEEQIEKVGFLKQLGADRLALSDLPLVGLKHFARRMMSRKAAALARIKDPHRTIEIACFLRLGLSMRLLRQSGVPPSRSSTSSTRAKPFTASSAPSTTA